MVAPSGCSGVQRVPNAAHALGRFDDRAGRRGKRVEDGLLGIRVREKPCLPLVVRDPELGQSGSFEDVGDSGLHDGIVVFLEGDLRPVCLKQILVNMKSRPEYFESRFEPFDRVFLGGLVQAFVIDA